MDISGLAARTCSSDGEKNRPMEKKMRIAISATGKDLDCQIASRFGRCAHFIVVETDDMSFEAFDNENAALPGSAGIQAATVVVSQRVQCVLTGNCGPKAAAVFSSVGIDVYTGQQGVVRDVVEKFTKGKISTATGTNVPEKFGAGSANIPIGAAASFGRGMGMGRGRRCMGGGRGMGMGRGMEPFGTGSAGGAGASKTENLERMKQQAFALKQEIKAIESKIKELE
jgi:predicted Fe-Mo cluster-binding NifX family protein